MSNSKRKGYDLELEDITVWNRLARNNDNDERAEDVIPNQCFKKWSRKCGRKIEKSSGMARIYRHTKISFWMRSRALSEEWNWRYASWYSDIRPWEKDVIEVD